MELMGRHCGRGPLQRLPTTPPSRPRPLPRSGIDTVDAPARSPDITRPFASTPTSEPHVANLTTPHTFCTIGATSSAFALELVLEPVGLN
jgi:hypothetical protein